MSSIFLGKDEEKVTHGGGETETTIGPSVRVEGTFHGEGNVIVEGEFVGSLKTAKNLTVGQNAHVKADVEAVNMSISGEVRGNIKASGKIVLFSSAKIFGDIETHIISVEAGAALQGNCVVGNRVLESANTGTSKSDVVRKKDES